MIYKNFWTQKSKHEFIKSISETNIFSKNELPNRPNSEWFQNSESIWKFPKPKTKIRFSKNETQKWLIIYEDASQPDFTNRKTIGVKIQNRFGSFWNSKTIHDVLKAKPETEICLKNDFQNSESALKMTTYKTFRNQKIETWISKNVFRNKKHFSKKKPGMTVSKIPNRPENLWNQKWKTNPEIRNENWVAKFRLDLKFSGTQTDNLCESRHVTRESGSGFRVVRRGWKILNGQFIF